MRKVLLCGAFLALAACSRDEEVQIPDSKQAHWDYENPNWHNQGYSECAGLVQSPINIVTTATTKATLPAITFNYSAFSAKAVNNGHTVQINTDGRSSITYNGVAYKLKQFHYHGHSEHSIDGQFSPLEVHFVHQNEATGAIVILGLLIKGGGTDNAQFAQYINSFPSVKNQEVATNNTINPLAMLPNNKKYYNYTGSLTTPPCSQGMNWIVFKEVLTISDAQLKKFTDLYNHNYRPIQKTGSRTVFESL